MKGISTVIATLLMLVITVALAITAYGYIQGLFTSTTTKSIEFVQASCLSNSSFFVDIRNTDQFNNVSTGEIIVRVDEIPAGSIVWTKDPIPANRGVTTGTISCGGAGQPTCVAGSAHRIKIIGPSGRPEQQPVSC